MDNVPFTTIPLYIQGGAILPLRSDSAMTTTEVRTKNFHLVIAPGLENTASGTLYLDDGDSLVQQSTNNVRFTYANGVFTMAGNFRYSPGNVIIEKITLLSSKGKSKELDVKIPLTRPYVGHIDK